MTLVKQSVLSTYMNRWNYQGLLHVAQSIINLFLREVPIQISLEIHCSKILPLFLMHEVNGTTVVLGACIFA